MISKNDFEQAVRNNVGNENVNFMNSPPFMYAFSAETWEAMWRRGTMNGKVSSLALVQLSDYAWTEQNGGTVIKDRGNIFTASAKEVGGAHPIYNSTYARRFQVGTGIAVVGFNKGDLITGKDRSRPRSIYKFIGADGEGKIDAVFVALDGDLGCWGHKMHPDQLKEFRLATDREIREALVGHPVNPMADSMLDDFRPSVNPPNGNPCAEIKLEEPKVCTMKEYIDASVELIRNITGVKPEELHDARKDADVTASLIKDLQGLNAANEDHGPCAIEPVSGPVCKLCGKREQEGVNYHDHWCPRGKEQA